MIIIENAEALEILTDATATTTEPAWSVGLVDASGATFVQAKSEAGATTGTSVVAMVTGAASTQKRVSSVCVYNRDTVSRTITIRRSSTLLIIKAVLVSGGALIYEQGAGWVIHNADGVPQIVTNLTGDVTSVGPVTTLANAPVIAKVLTGYTSGAGAVAATDSILQAIQKLNGNDATNANLTGPVTSTGNATAIADAALSIAKTSGLQAELDLKAPLISPAFTTPALGAATCETLTATDDLICSVVGKSLQVKSGTGQRAGNATLVAGTIAVSNTTVTANTVVILTRKTAGGTIGDLTYALSAGTSFTINSANAADTSAVSYLLIEVNP